MIDSVTSALGGALHEVDLAVNETFKSQTDLRDRLENIQVSRKHFLLKINLTYDMVNMLHLICATLYNKKMIRTIVIPTNKLLAIICEKILKNQRGEQLQ